MGGHGGDPEAEGHGLLGYIIGIKGKWEGKMKILEVEHVTKSFRKKKVIDGISFSVGEGKVVGFVGPNGAGKTTTLKLVTNILIPDSGSIHIAGFNILKEREKALSNVAGVIENPALYMELSGYDNLRFIQRAYGKSKSDMEQVIEMIGLGHAMRQKTGRYSLGMKQRLGLGMALLADPKFLILDEPTNGLDASGIIELRALICRKAKEGTTVLLSSHILSEVDRIADEVVFIKDGKIVEKSAMPPLRKKYLVKAGDAKGVLGQLASIRDAEAVLVNDTTVEFRVGAGDFAKAMRLVCQEEYQVQDIQQEGTQLEHVYQDIFREDA